LQIVQQDGNESANFIQSDNTVTIGITLLVVSSKDAVSPLNLELAGDGQEVDDSLEFFVRNVLLVKSTSEKVILTLEDNIVENIVKPKDHIVQGVGTSSHGGIVTVGKSEITSHKPDEFRVTESVIFILMISHIKSRGDGGVRSRFNSSNLSQSVVDNLEFSQTEVSITITVTLLEQVFIQNRFLAFTVDDFIQIAGGNSASSRTEKTGHIESVGDTSEKSQSN